MVCESRSGLIACVRPQSGFLGAHQSRSSRGSRRTNATSTARSAHSNRGRGLVRRSTATSCRSTSNSTSLAADDRPSRTSRPTSRTEIRYGSRDATLYDHAPTADGARSPQINRPMQCSGTPRDCPLVVVLGYDSCGAVGAAAVALEDGAVPAGYIRDVVERVAPSVPAVRAAGRGPGGRRGAGRARPAHGGPAAGPLPRARRAGRRGPGGRGGPVPRPRRHRRIRILIRSHRAPCVGQGVGRGPAARRSRLAIARPRPCSAGREARTRSQPSWSSSRRNPYSPRA